MNVVDIVAVAGAEEKTSREEGDDDDDLVDEEEVFSLKVVQDTYSKVHDE